MNDQTLMKLKSAVRASRKALSKHREVEQTALKRYMGAHFGDEGCEESQPVNMIEIAVTTLIQQVVAQEPQVLLLSQKQELEKTLKTTAAALNRKIIEMNLGEELRLFFMSGLFSMGIMKVGIAPTRYAEIDGEMLAETDVFAEHVPFKDWVHDTTATKWTPRQIQFCGHRYRVPLEWAKGNVEFDEEVRDRLQAESKATDDTGDFDYDSPLDRMDEDTEFVEHVELWDMWIPSEQKLVTYASSGSKPLLESKIERPGGHSPYHIFGVSPVLNSVMPLPPVVNWMDSNEITNLMLVKVSQQASRQKTVTFAAPTSVDDANKVIKSEDGDTITVANPGGIKEVRYGGPDQQSIGFAGYMRGMTSYAMGNLDTLAGLGSQTETATQEGFLKNSSSARVQALQGQLLKATKGVVRDILWWMWNSPTIQMTLTQEIEDTRVMIETAWPVQDDEYGFPTDMREGIEVELYDVDIEPYSMQNKPPTQRLTELAEIWERFILPMMQNGLVQGDPDRFLEMLGQYGDWPELKQLLISSNPSGGGGGSRNQAGPSHTSREYTRHNVSDGPSLQGAEREMMAAATGAG